VTHALQDTPGFRFATVTPMRRFAAFVQIWSLSLLACAAAAAFSFVHLDVPVARYFWDAAHPLERLAGGFGSRVILSCEAAVILTIGLVRLVRGHTPAFAKALAIACLASMCAYVINDHILKILCGVPAPAEVIEGAGHAFNIWRGSEGSSFPSGHMVLASAFAGVLMRLYRSGIAPLCVLLLLGAGLLLVGDWHFVSDIIAGAFFGTTAGLLAGELWVAHSSA